MNTVSGKKQQLLRRRDVQVVDVPAWGCDSAQSGGDGEEDHSKCVVAARVSCRHQEQRRSKHSCTVDSVILSTVESVFIFCFFDGGPYRSGIGSSWLWLWELCGFPSGNRPTAHSARQTAHSPGKAEPTACRSVSRHDTAVGQGFSTRPPHCPSWQTSAHLLYTEAQHVVHVRGQQREESVEGPVVGEVGDHYGPQRPGGDDGPPGDVVHWGGQLWG